MKFSILLFLLQLSIICAGQKSWTAQVVDAHTNEPLPFAQVYVSKDKGTVANIDGVFTISARENEELTISYVGYEQKRIKVTELTEVLRLKPLETILQEVTVKPRPIEEILIEAARYMRQSYKKHKDIKSKYFMRATRTPLDKKKKREILEAFIIGESAVNIRNMQFLIGRTNKYQEGFGNVYAIQQSGVVAYDVPFLKKQSTIVPLPANASRKFYEENYVIGYRVLAGNSGTPIYHVILGNKKGKDWIVTGNLYLDYETLRPLAIHGRLEGAIISNIKNNKLYYDYCDVGLNVDFTYENGFPEVRTSFIKLRNQEYINYWVLQRLESVKSLIMPTKGKSVSNMIHLSQCIREIGFDTDFWERNEIIKRTAEEEAIIKQEEQKRRVGGN